MTPLELLREEIVAERQSWLRELGILNAKIDLAMTTITRIDKVIAATAKKE